MHAEVQRATSAKSSSVEDTALRMASLVQAKEALIQSLQLEVEQQTRTAAREVDSLHAGFHTKLSNIRQQHESDMAASKAALSESQQASLGLSQEKGALQEEVMELRRALQASESAHKSLQLMLQQSVKERAELQKHLTSISKQAQQAKLVEPSPKVIAWGKSSPAGRAPQRQHSAPLGKPRARPSAELS